MYMMTVDSSLLPGIIPMFAKFNIKVAFKTNNKISNLLCIKQSFLLEEKTDIYRISCNNCDCFHLGQTGRLS